MPGVRHLCLHAIQTLFISLVNVLAVAPALLMID